MPKKKTVPAVLSEAAAPLVLSGAEIDINQMAKMYFGFGIMPWSFVRFNPYNLKDQLESAGVSDKLQFGRP